jgi:3-hydroxyisobutyrate dehydrogenase-like beta-hydroxyacid dehydrogenase
MKIAFLGLGKMGACMARNLLRTGFSVTVYNRSRDKAESLAVDGASIAGTPAEAVSNADVAATMLADDDATSQIVFGQDGIAEALKPGAIHIAHSTISTALARQLAVEHAHRGQGYLSAPVFGRPEAAEAKRLLVVPAGSPGLIERSRPLFDAIGRATFVAGNEPWQANAVKVLGNFMIASMIESFSEAFAMLRKAGVAPHLFLEIMTALFNSPVYATYGGLMADQRFEPAGFALRLGLKDIRLALETASETGASLPIADIVQDHMRQRVEQGQGEMDWSSLALITE